VRLRRQARQIADDGLVQYIYRTPSGRWLRAITSIPWGEGSFYWKDQEADHVVLIVAIGRKVRERVQIGGRWIEP
jgi:hypothetical protein